MGASGFVPGCFGKLPVAADFLSHHSGTGAAISFERWIRTGVGLGRSRFGSGWEKLLDEIPCTRFVFWNGDPASCLVGLILPGRDRSGRRFPFAVFLEGAPAEATRFFSAYPATFAPFFAGAERVAAGAPVDPVALTAEVDALADLAPSAAGVAAPVAEALFEGQTVATLEGTTTPPGPRARAGAVLRAARNLRALAGRQGTRTWPPSYGFRFPLPAGEDENATFPCFWLELVRRLFVRDRDRPPIFFWRAPVGEAGGGQLDLYLGLPEPFAFLHLVDPAFASDGLYPIDEDEGAAPSGSRPAPGDLDKLAEPTFPLSQALDLVAGDGA